MDPVPFSDMRDRVTIQSRTTAQGTAGRPVLTWSDVATVWAKIEPIDGTEQQYAGRVVSDVTHRITIRYYSGLTSKHRMTLGSRTFNLFSVIDESNRRRQHTCTAREEV